MWVLAGSCMAATGICLLTPYIRCSQAKNAFDNLNGFHLQDRYLVGGCRCSEVLNEASILTFSNAFATSTVLYHASSKTGVKADLARREAELQARKEAHGALSASVLIRFVCC